MNGSGTAGALDRRTLLLRADVFARIRAFFAARGVIEVDTPALSAAANPEPAIESARAGVGALGRSDLYLQTSPEFAMKRLLAAGSGDIFQLCRVFRDLELGRWHQPEFMMLEWYRVGIDEHALMTEVFELLTQVLRPYGHELEERRLTYADAFARTLGIDVRADESSVSRELKRALKGAGVSLPARGESRMPLCELLDLALGTTVIPALEPGRAWFIHDYPPDQAALAAIRPGDPPVAARFEVFVDGIELGNGYCELTDAREQRRRFEADIAKRQSLGRPAPPIDEALVAALEEGMPQCSGIALGVDRLIALVAGGNDLASAVNFPHRRDDVC
jgi:lysyl-tRNA synthetase class 2